LALLLAAVVAGGASAVDWKAYPEAIKQGNILVNAGLGFGAPLYGDTVIPPISASVDVALPLGGLPLSLGGYFGFTTTEYKQSYSLLSYNYGYTFSYTGMAFGGRVGYHPNFGVKNLDPYANLTLGYYLFTAKAEYTGDWGSSVVKTDPVDYSTFFFSANIGARYFFTPNIGAYAELGYSALSYVSAGLTVKL